LTASETPRPVILVVDDNAPMLYAKSRVLRSGGFLVHEAQTGADALRLALEIRPQVVLLDVKLPDMNGMEVCRRIRADPNLDLTLVLQTSATFVDGSSRILALDSGADSYLVEPMDSEELLANVRALLRLRRAEERVRENERLLRLATRTAKLNTWQFDLASAKSVTAAEFTAQSELPSLGQISSNGLYRLHPEDGPKLEAAFRAALEGRAEYDVQYRVVSRNGDVAWVAAQAAVVRDNAGKPVQVIGVALDITERKQADIERERLLLREQAARIQAEEATHLKDEFLATVSHELRTPLHAITGWVQLLRTGQLDPQASQRALESIERNAQAQGQLINDLLDISRIISGKLRLDLRPTFLGRVIEAAIDTVRPAAQAKNIRITTALDSDPGTIIADFERMQQVVWNLLSNAVKFSENDTEIRVAARRVGQTVEISVSDQGSGIAPEFLPHVFQAFRQADGSSTRKHPGLGLGLAIVKQLVELHHGTVSAHSAGPGQGATFTVSLPTSTAATSPAVSGREHWDEASMELANRRLGGVRVMVVDDDADARDIVATLLKRSGAEVTCASSAGEALELLRTYVPDVLLSDIGMPGQDGYSFIRAVRGLPSGVGAQVPAIALTAYARPDDRFRALSSGFQMHLAKPVEVHQLLKVVASLSGKP
jgi:signal transduction histidine kinase